MQWTVLDIAQTKPQRWNRDFVPGRGYGPRRGVPVSNLGDGEAVVDSMLRAAQLDCAMRDQLARILTVTLSEWARK